MASWRKGTRWCLKKGSHVCFWSLNCFLSGTACLQILILSLLLYQQSIPVPEQLFQGVAKRVLPKDLTLTWNRISFDLRGGIFAQDVHLNRTSTGDHLLQAKAIYLNLDFWKLLSKDPFPVETVGIENGTWFMLPSLSPTGLNEPLIHDVRLAMRMEGPHIGLDHFSATLGNLSLSADGAGTIPEIPMREARRWEDMQNFLTLNTLGLLDYVDKTESAQLHLQWRENAIQNNFVSAALSIEEGYWDNPKLKAKGILLTVPSFLLDSLQVLPGSHLEVEHLRLVENDVSLDHLNLYSAGSPHRYGAIQFPSEIHGMLGQLKWKDHRVNNISGDTPDFSFDSMRISGRYRNLHWIIRGSLSALQRQSAFSIEGQWEGPLLFGEIFPQIADIRLLPKIHSNGRFNATVLLPDEAEGLELKGFAAVSDFQSGDSLFSSIEAFWTYRKKEIDFSPLYAMAGPGEIAKGRYYQNLDPLDFRIQATGAAYLSTLDTFFGSWWDPVGETVGLKEPAEADVVVLGQWLNMGSFRTWVGAVSENAHCRDLDLDKLDLSLRFDGEKVHLYRLFGAKGDGSLKAEFAWLLNRSDYPGTSWWKGTSTLMRNEWVRLLPALDFPWLELSARPTVAFEAWLGRENTQSINFTLISKAPLKMKGFPFESAQLSGRWTNGQLTLPFLRMGVKGGLLSGRLNYGPEEGLEKFTAEVDLTSARYTETIQALSLLILGPNEKEKEAASKTPGILNATANLSGVLNQADTYTGFGAFTVNEANLGDIRLLGGLSRLFESVGVKFSTLRLEKALGSWVLKPGLLTVSQIDLTGPSMSLSVYGTVTVPESALSLKVNAFAIKSLFGLVTSPIHSNLSFELNGTLKEPKWDFQLSPFQWMKSKNP